MFKNQGVTPSRKQTRPSSPHVTPSRSTKSAYRSSPLRNAQSANTLDTPQKNNPNVLIVTTPSLDHILKATKAAGNQRARTRSSSIVTNPYEEPAPNEAVQRDSKPRGRSGRFSKYSPTPSIKRGKAEKLIKEHGSPPGIRVTAGGRIVPDSLSPINSPLDGTSAPFRQGQKNGVFPQFPVHSPVNAAPLNGFVVNVGNGNLCQVVDGSLRPIEQQNGTLHLHMPAPNLPTHSDLMPMALGAPQESQSFLSVPPITMNTRGDRFLAAGLPNGRSQPLPTAREIRVMEQAHSQLEQELKDLDRNEVLQRGSISNTQRSEIVRRRVDLVTSIDESRKAVTNAKRLVEEGSKHAIYHPQSLPRDAEPPVQTISASQAPFPLMNLQYYAAAAPLQMDHFDPNGFVGPQHSFQGNFFEPGVPDFVPKSHFGYGQPTQHPPSFALQERPGNIEVGAKHRADGSGASTETIKATDSNNPGTRSMNFDGSAHQPRRSRAIEIKKPFETSAKPKPSLDPTSPTYRPTNLHSSTSGGQDANFGSNQQYQQFLGPQSHIQSQGTRDNFAGDFQDSDTSFTTVDFFPTDSYKYSATRQGSGQRDNHVNLPAWLPKAGEATTNATQGTPSRPPNKFLFDDESPGDQYFVNQSNENQTTVDQDYQRRRSSESKGSVERVDRASHLRESMSTIRSAPRTSDYVVRKQPSTSKLLQIASERAATLTNLSPRKSDSYWEGYRIGFHQDVLTESKDEDYRIGYRDGLLQSSSRPNRAPFQSQVSSPTPENPVGRLSDQGWRINSMPKATSFPGLGALVTSPVPNPPANSLATTPTHSRSVRKDPSPGFEPKITSSYRNETTPGQNVSFSSITNRMVGTQTSNSLLRGSSTISPLADRSPASNIERSVSVEQDRLGLKGKGRLEDFERQRYQKSSCSAVQTNTSARAYFRPQYDGSADDEEQPLSRSEPNVPSPSTPRQKEKAKVETSGSPIKTKASAAVATMRQFAGIGLKKNENLQGKQKKKAEESGSPPTSSPEKKKRGEDWAKNFRQTK